LFRKPFQAQKINNYNAQCSFLCLVVRAFACKAW